MDLPGASGSRAPDLVQDFRPISGVWDQNFPDILISRILENLACVRF